MLLPLLYLPPISWFHFLLNEENILVERHENFPKQSLRSRCQIYGANGKLDLSIPIHKNGKRAYQNTEISYREAWQKLHWKSIKNVYQASPFFEYYEDKLQNIYQQEIPLLWDFNLHALQVIFQILKIEKFLPTTDEYRASPEMWDARNAFHSKKESDFYLPEYYQIFSDKYGFLKDLSIIDLLCHLGPETLSYIKNLNIKPILE